MVASDKITYDYDEVALAIDKMLLTKTRLITVEFLKKILVLQSIFEEEKTIREGMGIDRDYTIETAHILRPPEYAPDLIEDLLVNLQENNKNEVVDVNPDWIKKVLMLYEEVTVNYQLCLIADKFSE